MHPNYFLTTERIGFRRWAVEDFPLARGLWGDPEVTTLIDARGQLSETQVREPLLREITTQASHGVQYWPVFLLDTGEHLGCAGLRPYRLEQGIYEIGVHLRPRHWGQGYATEAARAVMAHAFGPLGYAVMPVRLGGCLHLKSACCALDEETLLVNRTWLDTGAFSGLRLVEVPADEPAGANVLPLPGATLISAACPRTAELVCALGHPAASLDVSELHKAEAGLTCLSLVFGNRPSQGWAPA